MWIHIMIWTHVYPDTTFYSGIVPLLLPHYFLPKYFSQKILSFLFETPNFTIALISPWSPVTKAFGVIGGMALKVCV